MFSYIADTLRANPQLAIFFTLAIGYWVGTRKFGSFSLGAVTGTLLAGIVIGQLGIEISGQVKSIFFIMFLFAVGFGVGPQFVRGIASDGLPQALFAAVVSVLCLLSVYFAAIVAGYGPGLAAGLLAGAQTISASIGLATDAINNSGLTPEQAQAELNLIPVAYAITYLFGTVGTGWVLAFLGPKILRVDMVAECARYEREMSVGAPESGFLSGRRKRELRAYRVPEGGKVIGMTVAQVERDLLPGERIFVEGLRSGDAIVEVGPDTKFKAGDVVAVAGPRDILVNVLGKGTEVDDVELLDVPVEAVDVLLTNKDLDGRTLAEAAGKPFARGVFLNSIRRGSTAVNIPVLPQTKLNRGDILRVAGTKASIDRFVAAAGYADRPLTVTNMTLVGLAILVGGLIGAYVLPDRRCAHHLVHLGWRADRGHLRRLAAHREAADRQRPSADPVVHELGGPQRLHRNRRHQFGPDLHRRVEGGRVRHLLLGSLRHRSAHAAGAADRKIHFPFRSGHQSGLLRRRAHLDGVGRHGR
jgi:putative transport protein